MPTFNTNLRKLVDMSVGTADINFQLLHSLLRVLVSKVDGDQIKVEVADDANIMPTFAKKLPIRYIDVYEDKDSKAMRVQYDTAKDFPERADKKDAKKDEAVDVIAMFEQMNIGKRMDSAEMTIAKLTSLIHKLMRQLEAQESKFDNFQLTMENQLSKLDEIMMESERKMVMLATDEEDECLEYDGMMFKSKAERDIYILNEKLQEMEAALNNRFEAIENKFNEKMETIQSEFQQSLLCLLKQLGKISEEIQRLLHIEETLALLAARVDANRDEFEGHLEAIRHWQMEADMRFNKMNCKIREFQEETEEQLAADIRERKRQYGYFVDHLEGVKNTKANTEDVERLLDCKATKEELSSRVPNEVFNRELNIISSDLGETVTCFKALEMQLKNIAADFVIGLSTKADKKELCRIRGLVETKMKWLAKVCVDDEDMKASCILCDQINN